MFEQKFAKSAKKILPRRLGDSEREKKTNVAGI